MRGRNEVYLSRVQWIQDKTSALYWVYNKVSTIWIEIRISGVEKWTSLATPLFPSPMGNHTTG